MKHQFEEYGSLASPCLRCNIPFAYAGTYRGWVGIPCRQERYTPSEELRITNRYLAHWEPWRREFTNMTTGQTFARPKTTYERIAIAQ
ncbi:hypothetical protein CMI37_28750 [Candidatus Pacearchaeota archaeon]|nr:hypothetical protein [Candidatus Pacearchaeota archaeon]